MATGTTRSSTCCARTTRSAMMYDHEEGGLDAFADGVSSLAELNRLYVLDRDTEGRGDVLDELRRGMALSSPAGVALLALPIGGRERWGVAVAGGRERGEVPVVPQQADREARRGRGARGRAVVPAPDRVPCEEHGLSRRQALPDVRAAVPRAVLAVHAVLLRPAGARRGGGDPRPRPTRARRGGGVRRVPGRADPRGEGGLRGDPPAVRRAGPDRPAEQARRAVEAAAAAERVRATRRATREATTAWMDGRPPSELATELWRRIHDRQRAVGRARGERTGRGGTGAGGRRAGAGLGGGAGRAGRRRDARSAGAPPPGRTPRQIRG